MNKRMRGVEGEGRKGRGGRTMRETAGRIFRTHER